MISCATRSFNRLSVILARSLARSCVRRGEEFRIRLCFLLFGIHQDPMISVRSLV